MAESTRGARRESVRSSRVGSFWEQAGVSGELTVAFPIGAKYATATPVNLRGEKAGPPVTVQQGKLTFNLNAYAPGSYILK